MSKHRLLSTAAILALNTVTVVAPAHAVDAGATAQDVAFGDPVAQTVYLALRNPAGAEAYAQAVQTPGNASFHQFLTVSQFVSRFGPTNAEVAKVEAALTRAGYIVSTVFPNHLGIQVTAPAGATEQALGIKLKHMTEHGRTGMVPVGDIVLPGSIHGLVRGIGGLDTLHRPHSERVRGSHGG